MSKPRRITTRELNIMQLYIAWEYGMAPQQFYSKWDVSYEQIALICCRSDSTVRGWFRSGNNKRYPTFNDRRHLALLDFLLEHFEEIPQALLELLYPSQS
ncbi:hypothetical protein DSM106972_047750 [Dulcicalothrix desertica PCC 7102]|uniref:Helix-turn-helix domain-containing protein n=1 Tax=Dulcicalothrix desertica PCC 7102 TaxID=232991 RepID=A0A3S1ALF4_9CYAN|nr:hypothetical protein [Dulcicalothrix desertica]RUT03861.1 hypothetical protein DSM106972_047750 [Dulcicalothrix desertica PCC 7102]TWH43728.1 hypothetical protein CAL7102_07472 [Dulcicalothrix desertica PCC 7102]